MKKIFLLLSLILSILSTIQGQERILCPTPPMGWNTWNCFNRNINEEQIREIADLMISTGLKDAGYTYLTAGKRTGKMVLSKRTRQSFRLVFRILLLTYIPKA